VDGENPPTLINTTSYPVSLSMGSTWDPALAYRVATAISDEAREVVRDNTLDLNFYSPTVNLGRDPRWGRNDETYSEDPYLTAAIASQYVDGMEGKDSTGRPLPEGGGYLKTSTTLKHYAANNSEVNRRTGSSDMDQRTLREYYTKQFRSIIAQADPASIMTAYNAVNGVPASANVHLLQTLGRQTFGFAGFYTSDCDAIYELQAGHQWTPPGAAEPVNPLTRNAYANAAGVDLDCDLGYHDTYNYANQLPDAVTQQVQTELGTFTEADLDASLVRLFTVRIMLGEFDDPATVPWVTAARSRVPAGSWVNTDDNHAVTETPERLALARVAADESIVLLRNESSLLPLRIPPTGGWRLAVVGGAARPAQLYEGGYSSAQGTTGIGNEVNGFDGILTAVHAVNPSATVDYLDASTALDKVASYDAVVVYAGTDATVAAEDTDRTDLALPYGQADLAAEVAARNPNTVVYLETVGQVDLGALDGVRALLWSSYNGQRRGEALADVLFGATNPSGHLPFTWYRDASQLPPIEDYGIRPTAASPGRTYQYFAGAPSYPFGYGLSYTTFGYGPARIDKATATPDDTVTVSVAVTNTGAVPGDEVVQLYAATPDGPADAQRPVKRLVGFAKVSVPAGQTVAVALPVRLAELAFFDEQAGRWVVDPGRYRFELGSSSVDIQQSVELTVAGPLTPVPAVVTVTADEVVAAPGTQVQPRLTVAMNDDTLYLGALPDGMTVALTSDRPGVVAVEADGTVRTVAPGVATVTATVTYGGASATADMVLVVRALP